MTPSIREKWKVKFSPRNLMSLSSEPFLLFPTHYTGEQHYISDTEDSVTIDKGEENEEDFHGKGGEEEESTVADKGDSHDQQETSVDVGSDSLGSEASASLPVPEGSLEGSNLFAGSFQTGKDEL